MASGAPTDGAGAGRWDPQQDGGDDVEGGASPMNLRRQPSEQKEWVTPSRTALRAVRSSTVMPQMGSVAMPAGVLVGENSPNEDTRFRKKGGGRRSSPAATHAHGSADSRYFPQQPEPQHPSGSACTPAVGHSSTQQAQVQLVHSHPPVSQHPQHSHVPQPPFWPLMVAGTKASAIRRIRLFMEKPFALIGRLNRSRHVTTCDRGKATASTRTIGLTSADGMTRLGGRFSSARRRRELVPAGSARPVTPPRTPG